MEYMIGVTFIVLLIGQAFFCLAGFFKMLYTYSRNDAGFKQTDQLFRMNGILWLLTSCLFSIAVILFIQKDKMGLIVAVLAIVLSQFLIFIHLKKKVFGTVLNLIVVVLVILTYRLWKLEAFIEQETKAMYAAPDANPVIVTKEMINNQPSVLHQWLFRANILNKAISERIFLEQKGEMRTSPSGEWMKFSAKEYFVTSHPSFLWNADVEGSSWMKFKGLDHYQNGKGQMRIYWFSVFPVTDASGSKIDQGSLLRYLAEIVWFPSAAFHPYIHWQQLDSMHAKATMEYKDVRASGIFTFNSSGDVISFEAQRFYDRKEGVTLEDWLVTIDGNSYAKFEGVRVPTKAKIIWKLKSGDFNWFNLEIQNIHYGFNRK